MPPKSNKDVKKRGSKSDDRPKKKQKRTPASSSSKVVKYTPLSITSRPAGLTSSSDIITSSAWGPSIPSGFQPWMDTPTGAAANLLSRVWWPFTPDRINAVDVLARITDLVEDVNASNILRKALVTLNSRDAKSKATFSEKDTALALLRLSGGEGVQDSSAAGEEITSHIVAATASLAMSSTESVALHSTIRNCIALIGACLRQWTNANSRHDLLNSESLHAHAAKQFYITHFSEFCETDAVKQLVEDPSRLDQVMSINKGSKCSVASCKRVARLPSAFCAAHGDAIKRAGGSRSDIADEDDTLKHQRKSTLAYLKAPGTQKLLRASSRRVSVLLRNKAISRVAVTSKGKVAVYDRVTADKIAKKEEELKESQVDSVELVLPPRIGLGTPASFKRLLEDWRKEDYKVFTPEVRSAMLWFRIYWRMVQDDKATSTPLSDDSDFEAPGACARKTEDVVGTGRLIDCPEATAEGIIRRLTKRPRSATFMDATEGGTDRVSRHQGKWPKDCRNAVREFLSVLKILDPVATCNDLRTDNPTESFDVQEHTATIARAIEACEHMIARIDNQISMQRQSPTTPDQLAEASERLLESTSLVSKVSRWTTKDHFNKSLVHDALASLLGALCIVTRRWISMPMYTAIETTSKEDKCVVWRAVNLCRATTVKILGFASNDASIELDRFPEYAEYVPQEIQTTVAQQLFDWLESSELDPTIVVLLSNEPINIKGASGSTPSLQTTAAPTDKGAVDGIQTDQDGVPLAEVARWNGCLDELGYGVRAKTFIPAGTKIASVHFRVYHPSKRESKFALEDPDGLTRCIGDRALVRWMNGADFKGASLRPKALIQFTSLSTEDPSVWVVAAEDIEIGQEITMNYGTTFRAPHSVSVTGSRSRNGIPVNVVRSLEADTTMQRFGRITQIRPAWSEPGIKSFDATGSAWAARRWETVEKRLMPTDWTQQAGFCSVNTPTEFYYAELSRIAVDIPPELTYTARDASGKMLKPASAATKPKPEDFFDTDKNGNIKGLKDDFDTTPYGASILSYEGLREIIKIGISPSAAGKGKKQGRLTGTHFNRALKGLQTGSKYLKATITDAHIRPVTEHADPTTKEIHARSLLLKSDVCRSIQEIHPVGPCVLRSYLDSSLQDPDEIVPAQLTLQGMNNCTLFATFNHTYEGVWHIEPDSAVSLNENIGLDDGFVIIVSDQKAIMEICKFHLFMELAAPGGVDLSELRKGSTHHGAIHASHRGLPWLSRPPHPALLARLGIDTTSFKVYRQRPGDTIFIPGGTLHAVVHRSPSVRVACGYVSTADACRTVLRSAQFKNEGSKSTLWSVTKSVHRGDVDVGVALNLMAKDHGQNPTSARWNLVDIASLRRLVLECAETLINTSGFKKLSTGGKKKKRNFANIAASRMRLPVRCQVAGSTGPTFMVTPAELLEARDYFHTLGVDGNGRIMSARHRGERSDLNSTPTKTHTVSSRTAQQKPKLHSKLRLRKNDTSNPNPEGDDDDIVTMSEQQRSTEALSRRRTNSQFVELYNMELLRQVIGNELIGLTSAQAQKLETSLQPGRFGNEKALQVELALLETACNLVLEGKVKVIFQHPAHQTFCYKAMTEGIATAGDIQQALKTPPVRNIPGEDTAVHVFTINIGDNQPRPDHFASVVCRTDSTVACVLDSASTCAPISRNKAVENLRACLCAAQFFQVKGQVQMMHAKLSEQDIANKDYTCMERAVLNAAYVVCYENKPYDKVVFEIDMEYYVRLSEIIGKLWKEIRRTEQAQDPVDIQRVATNRATATAVDEVVDLLKSLKPDGGRRTSPRKTN